MPYRPAAPGLLIDGKYRLAERIGGGGMGEVYRAENVLAGRAVALKFLRSELAEDTELAHRFFQEAQAVNRIRHPNIVDVLDAGVAEAGPYLVMEYLDGEGVGAALARLGRFELEAAVATAIPVLEALEAAHRVGIVHRDLKPENVFFAVDPARSGFLVRLLDFGIAKVFAGTGPSPRTRTGIVFGTPDYLSPEQATGEGPLDGRSDLFAVGVLLYELLTGTRPFKAPTAVATAFRVVHAEAPTLASAGLNVGPKLEALVARLLQKDPARRFPTAGDVARELERIVPDAARRSAALARIVLSGRRGKPLDVDLLASREPPPAPRPRMSSSPDFDLSGGLPRARMSSTPDIDLASGLPLAIAPTRFVGRTDASGARTEVTPYAPASDRTIETPRVSEPSRLSDPGRISDPGRPPDAARGSDPGRASKLDRPTPPSLLSSSERTLMSGAPSRAPVRPLPARFAGRFKVRGPLLRGVDRTLVERYGREARDEVVGQMPERYASDFRNDSINALVSYELEALDAYMELATTLVVRDTPKWRDLGRHAVGNELESALRTALRFTPELDAAIRRGVLVWSRLLGFGKWRVDGTLDRVTVHISEIDPASLALRLWLAGIVEETMRRAVRPELKLVILLGEIGFTPELTFEIA